MFFSYNIMYNNIIVEPLHCQIVLYIIKNNIIFKPAQYIRIKYIYILYTKESFIPGAPSSVLFVFVVSSTWKYIYINIRHGFIHVKLSYRTTTIYYTHCVDMMGTRTRRYRRFNIRVGTVVPS